MQRKWKGLTVGKYIDCGSLWNHGILGCVTVSVLGVTMKLRYSRLSNKGKWGQCGFVRGSDNTVGVPNTYWMDGPCCNCRQTQDIPSSPKHSTLALWPTQPPIQFVGVPLRRWRVRVVTLSTHLNLPSRLRMSGAIPPRSPYVFMQRTGIFLLCSFTNHNAMHRFCL
jgi:hypothetical protein